MCKKNNDVENVNKPDVVPIYVYDDQVARASHRDFVHWIAHGVMTAVIVFIISIFIWYLNQYDYVSNETVTVDGAEGIANYIGKDGNIYNGQDSGEAYTLAHEEERQQQGNP